jgi:dihydropteroate synthase
VAAHALEAGVGMINDITALSDPALLPMLVQYRAQVVLMHMQGTPQTMQAAPHYEEVTIEVATELFTKATTVAAAGIPQHQIWLDPGIGFGKTPAHNLQLLRETEALVGSGFPVLIGVSRKSLFAQLGVGDRPENRLTASLVTAVKCFEKGAAMFRVHDVLETKKALLTAQELVDEVSS